MYKVVSYFCETKPGEFMRIDVGLRQMPNANEQLEEIVRISLNEFVQDIMTVHGNRFHAGILRNDASVHIPFHSYPVIQCPTMQLPMASCIGHVFGEKEFVGMLPIHLRGLFS